VSKRVAQLTSYFTELTPGRHAEVHFFNVDSVYYDRRVDVWSFECS